MKKVSLAGAVIFLIAALAFLSLFAPGTIFPRFGEAAGCGEAAVVIYNGDYNSVTGEVSLLIRNQGRRHLQLETFITRPDGTVTKHQKRIYLSAGGEGTFTLENVDQAPAEVTVRDMECGTADLWKAF
jgi:hypothetical protein